MASERWISKLEKGGLHRSLHVPMGQKISKSAINAAAKRPGKVGKQARAAKTLAKLRKRR